MMNQHELEDGDALHLDNHFPVDIFENDEHPEEIINPEEQFPERVPIQIDGRVFNFPGQRTPSQEEVLASTTHVIQINRNCLIEYADDKKRRTAILVGALGMLSHIPVVANRTEQDTDEDDDSESSDSSSDFSVPGKTLALQGSAARKIYFATKTEREMDEVLLDLKMLRNTGYLEDLDIGVLLSRNINEPCSVCQLQNERECTPPPPGNNYFQFIDDDCKVHTISSLMEVARRRRFCPYKLLEAQDLSTKNFILCPQQFIISSFIRDRNGIRLDKNCIQIFDDGSNIEKACEQEGSLSITTTMLTRAAVSLENCADSCRRGPMSVDVGEVTNVMINFSARLGNFSRRFEEEKPVTEEAIRNLLMAEGFWGEEIASYRRHFLRFLRCLDSEAERPAGVTLRPQTTIDISKFLTALQHYFQTVAIAGESLDFKLVSETLPNPSGGTDIHFRALCVDPSIIFKEFSGPASTVIISSRCLPTPSILLEQIGPDGFIDPVKINYQEVARRFFSYCGQGPNSCRFDFSHKDKRRLTVHTEVGEAVLELCEAVPNGIILLFSSRKAIEDRVKQWRSRENREISIWEELTSLKHVFNELDFDYEPDDAKIQIENFRRLCTNPIGNCTGAIMLALHRGNVFELMNFHKGEVRLIANIGIPFNSWVAANVSAKRSRYTFADGDERAGLRKFYKWYNCEAFHIVNQSFSHCVREGQNWIAVIVLDQRMMDRDFSLIRPSWIYDHIIRRYSFEAMMKDLRRFVEESQDRAEDDLIE